MSCACVPRLLTIFPLDFLTARRSSLLRSIVDEYDAEIAPLLRSDQKKQATQSVLLLDAALREHTRLVRTATVNGRGS